mgnify:CR=1 FL=1
MIKNYLLCQINRLIILFNFSLKRKPQISVTLSFFKIMIFVFLLNYCNYISSIPPVFYGLFYSH